MFDGVSRNNVMNVEFLKNDMENLELFFIDEKKCLKKIYNCFIHMESACLFYGENNLFDEKMFYDDIEKIIKKRIEYMNVLNNAILHYQNTTSIVENLFGGIKND